MKDKVIFVSTLRMNWVCTFGIKSRFPRLISKSNSIYKYAKREAELKVKYCKAIKSLRIVQMQKKFAKDNHFLRSYNL